MPHSPQLRESAEHAHRKNKVNYRYQLLEEITHRDKKKRGNYYTYKKGPQKHVRKKGGKEKKTPLVNYHLSSSAEVTSVLIQSERQQGIRTG